jgi:hypothetical protein
VSAPKLAGQAPILVDLDVTPLKVAVPTNVYAVATNLGPEAILASAIDFNVQHICQKDGFNFEKEIKVTELLVRQPDSLIECPLSTIMDPENYSKERDISLTRLVTEFSSSTEKELTIERIVDCLVSNGISRALTEDVLAVSDELFTNAIYNAPFVDLKTGRNPGVSRQDAEVRMDFTRKGSISLAFDQSQLVISCRDPYGSLNIRHFIEKIQKTYSRGPAATLNFGPGGAGLGSYIIFNTGLSLYFGVDHGHTTVVCCVIPVGLSYRRRIQLPKHLHLVQL